MLPFAVILLHSWMASNVESYMRQKGERYFLFLVDIIKVPE